MQPDSIIPNPANPQNWNRYSYVGNNPIGFNDPSGHYPQNCGPDNIYCGGLPENDYYHVPAPGQGGGGGGGGCSEDDDLCWLNQDDDFPPALPDPSLTAPPVNGNPCPNAYNYVQCYYGGYMLVLNGDVAIDHHQFNLLLIAIYFDLKNRAPVEGYDFETRSKYDTPFWNGNGFYPGNLCINNKCYERSTVNYIAQGMWVAASGQSLIEGDAGVQAWNIYKYRHLANADELYWSEFGYNNFNALDPLYSQLMSGYGR